MVYEEIFESNYSEKREFPQENNQNREKAMKIEAVLTCANCGKKFICQARASEKYPSWKPDCRIISVCNCDKCNVANKMDKYCRNVIHNPSYNPSSRLNFLDSEVETQNEQSK